MAQLVDASALVRSPVGTWDGAVPPALAPQAQVAPGRQAREGGPSPSPIGRRAQIDGLRCLAMVGVVYVHTWRADSTFEHLRVSLFFVVTGFLITAILMAARDRGDAIVVRNFYVRRLLRLAPALVLVVAATGALGIGAGRDTVPWHLLQLSNILFATTKEFRPWNLSHLWSLNVVEQFYLLWPPVILFLSLARIRLVTVALILGFVVVRLNAAALGLDVWWTNYVIAADPIAAGALFCLLMRSPGWRAWILSPVALAVALAAVASPLLLGSGWGGSESYRLLLEPALAVVVCGAFMGWRGPVGRLLQSPPALFLSRTSYGVYMYHLTVWWALSEIWPALDPRGPLTFVVVLAASILAAWLSWIVVEQPMDRLKARFPISAAASRAR